ncbi:MFS transporter [Gluconacetobacter johannae]|uniref:MFS transporter n=1 Tax=Gluconacetobacter johannae TaxID=112140 RepID=A0A7W4P5V4_9PROT|nr:MFS transporter [Gluconacetobacter johannae]MBB2175215.1 MFS transporter [Gluconacetobacter johannae]
MFFFAFIDRVNISFAAMDMRRDLSIPATTYGLGAGIFFLGYFIFEIPGNYILTKVGARTWLAVTMVTWGIISAGMAFIGNGRELLLLRFLLGIAEAGFYPGTLFFLMQSFPEKWHGRVISYLIVVIPVSSAVSSLLSGMILHLSGIWGFHGWQWIFLLEGLPSTFLGILLFICLPNSVGEAGWLSHEEREYLCKVRQRRVQVKADRTAHSFLAVARDPYVWKLASIFFCLSFVNGTIHFWLPQMIGSVGFDKYTVMRLLPIPYFIGAVALIICAARLDRSGKRRWNILIPMGLAFLCLILTIVCQPLMMKGIFITIAIASLFTVLGLMWVVPGQILQGPAAAGGIALINSIGNLGNFFGPSIFSGLVQETGHYSVGLVMDSVVMFLSFLIFYVISAEKSGDVPL